MDELAARVQAVTAEGFSVRIAYGDVGGIFDDGFESGDADTWSGYLP